MSTLEDIFYSHEKTIGDLTIGETTIIKKRVTWEAGFNKQNRSVLKEVITNLTGFEMLKTRHYIKPGEMCAICLEGIYMKRDAFLNTCGHGFHYSCLSQSCLYNKACPLCREDVCLDSAQKQIYSKNGITRAEQIEITPSISFPQLCYRKRKPFHYLGTELKCVCCKIFIGIKNN